MLEKGKFPCFRCSRILQRVNQLSRRGLIIAWENYNGLSRKRSLRWTLNCQTAAWCFSQRFGAPTLSKLCHQLHRTSRHYPKRCVLAWSKPGSRTSVRTFCICQDAPNSCTILSFSLLPSLVIAVMQTAVKKRTEWVKVNATLTALRCNSRTCHSELLNYWT